MKETYENLFLCSHKYKIGCDYFYTVTSGGASCTAFRTKEELTLWLETFNLTVEKIPELKEEWRGEIKGEFCRQSYNSYDNFYALKNCASIYYPANSNGVTMGIITEEGGVKTLNYLNPNNRFRPMLNNLDVRKALEMGVNPAEGVDSYKAEFLFNSKY